MDFVFQASSAFPPFTWAKIWTLSKSPGQTLTSSSLQSFSRDLCLPTANPLPKNPWFGFDLRFLGFQVVSLTLPGSDVSVPPTCLCHFLVMLACLGWYWASLQNDVLAVTFTRGAAQTGLVWAQTFTMVQLRSPVQGPPGLHTESRTAILWSVPNFYLCRLTTSFDWTWVARPDFDQLEFPCVF